MYKYIKRITDVIVSSLLLLALVPLFLVVAVIIKIESKGPVLFRQRRFGRNKQPFECLKFRTMTTKAPSDQPTRHFKNSQAFITKSGRWLRRFGIDELPQLINIIKGDMSLIGPRPVVLTETDLINERDKYGANFYRPGIGGWAQSNGRDEIDVKEKAHLDGVYAQNFSAAMDISCVWRTFVAIFSSRGFKEGGPYDTDFSRRVEKRTHKIFLVKKLKAPRQFEHQQS